MFNNPVTGICVFYCLDTPEKLHERNGKAMHNPLNWMLGLQHKDFSALLCNGNPGQSSLYLQGLRSYNSLVKGILLKGLTLNS